MSSSEIDHLLDKANTSDEGDTSVTSASRRFDSESDAVAFFDDLCRRLLRIDQWNENSSVTKYELFGEGRSDGGIRVGSFVRIKL